MWKAWYPEVFPGTTQVKIFEHGAIQRREGCRSLKHICENKSDSMHFSAGRAIRHHRRHLFLPLTRHRPNEHHMSIFIAVNCDIWSSCYNSCWQWMSCVSFRSHRCWRWWSWPRFCPGAAGPRQLTGVPITLLNPVHMKWGLSHQYSYYAPPQPSYFHNGL